MPTFKILIDGSNIRPPVGFFGYSTVATVTDGKEVILCDLGAYGIRQHLASLVPSLGITRVFLSHLHYDHCANICLCKGLPVHVSKKEIARLIQDAHDGPYSDISTMLLKQLEQVKLVEFSEEHALTANTKVILTPGHTLGHASLMFKTSENKKVVFAGDAIRSPLEYQLTEPPKDEESPQSYVESRHNLVSNCDIVIPGHGEPIYKGETNLQKIALHIF